MMNLHSLREPVADAGRDGLTMCEERAACE